MIQACEKCTSTHKPKFFPNLAIGSISVRRSVVFNAGFVVVTFKNIFNASVRHPPVQFSTLVNKVENHPYSKGNCTNGVVYEIYGKEKPKCQI
jgi:hypothetical protein